MNPPIILLTTLFFGLVGSLEPAFQKAQEKKMQRREDSMKAYDEWNHFMHEEIERVENKDYLLANKKAMLMYLSLEKAQRLKEACLEKEKKSKIEQQKEDPQYYIVFCSDKDQPFKEISE